MTLPFPFSLFIFTKRIHNVTKDANILHFKSSVMIGFATFQLFFVLGPTTLILTTYLLALSYKGIMGTPSEQV
jgi:hypothetical protein